MKRLWKRQADVDAPEDVKVPSVAGSMSRVHSLGTKALVGGFYFVMALTVVVAFAALVLSLSKDITVSADASTVQQPQTDNAPAAYAEGFVGAWLSASSTDHAALDTYLDASSVGMLPSTGWVYRDLGLAGTETPEGSTLTAVTVAANVKETAVVDGKATESWPRRYFRAVVNSDGGLSPVGLPSPVSGPVPATSVITLRYPETVSTSSDAATTVSSFITAYATGAGGLDRYTTPGSAIAPITPAPFSSASLRSLNADKTPSAAPKDGETLHVLVGVNFKTAQNQGSASTYAMTLNARAGRWEVSALNPTPDIEKTNKPSSTKTPTERPTP